MNGKTKKIVIISVLAVILAALMVGIVLTRKVRPPKA